MHRQALISSKQERSPWLITPFVQSNPKLGTSLGALGGYLHNFDEKSRPSIFALQGQYSNTDSIIGGGFARTSFDEDRQRLIAGLMYGYVKNDYDDYLDTGVPLKSNAELRSFITRYLYRVKGNWFVVHRAFIRTLRLAVRQRSTTKCSIYWG